MAQFIRLHNGGTAIYLNTDRLAIVMTRLIGDDRIPKGAAIRVEGYEHELWVQETPAEIAALLQVVNPEPDAF